MTYADLDDSDIFDEPDTFDRFDVSTEKDDAGDYWLINKIMQHGLYEEVSRVRLWLSTEQKAQLDALIQHTIEDP